MTRAAGLKGAPRTNEGGVRGER
ncbi:hypothetical protein E2C01_048981 [Portunus trituberculatus]|uniref:Uncharacterized protein n=1 Tax=Portunus trituberculatus TaxID=210409 RepID=A0A5B7GBM1_PORTR|nr:hypothetical protein [Portunus trituberculatus]